VGVISDDIVFDILYPMRNRKHIGNFGCLLNMFEEEEEKEEEEESR